MQYEPVKNYLGPLFSKSPLLRKLFYFLIDTLLLRTWHVKRALRQSARQLPSGASVLDAGSGLGQYSWRMSRMNRNWKIKGVDINQAQVEECNEFFRKTGNGERVVFSTADLTKFTDPDAYDMVLSVDVMEHIADDRQVFMNFSKSMRKGGILVISTPSDKGGSDVHDEHSQSFIDEHVRNGYSIEDIESKLTDAGFTNIVTKYTYGCPGSLSWHLSMKYPVKLLNISYVFFILLPFYYLIVFPFALILNTFDVMLSHNSGTGLLVTARKP